MANEKQISSRIQHKHDIEANWEKATNFIPKAGEIVIYDAESGRYNFPRIKIGNGTTYVNSLPFFTGDPALLVTDDKNLVNAINELYFSIYEKSDVSVTDLTNTTWLLNDEFSLTSAFSYNINFASNNINYSTFKCEQQSGGMYFLCYNSTQIAYKQNYGGYQFVWSKPSCKLITIIDGTDVNNTNLITWLETNATCLTTMDKTTHRIQKMLYTTTEYPVGSWFITSLPTLSTSSTIIYASGNFSCDEHSFSSIKSEYYQPYSAPVLYYGDVIVARGSYSSGQYTLSWIDTKYQNLDILTEPDDATLTWLNNCNATFIGPISGPDSSLTTEAQTVFGAINEINEKTQKLDDIDVDAILDIQDTLYFDSADEIKDLLNSTWLIDADPSLNEYSVFDCSDVRFVSNQMTFTGFSIVSYGNGYAFQLQYGGTNYCSKTASATTATWTSDNYRTVQFIGGNTTDSTLIAWLHNNATLISGGASTKVARTLPVFTPVNNNQFLKIVDGQPTWVTIAAAEENSF